MFVDVVVEPCPHQLAKDNDQDSTLSWRPANSYDAHTAVECRTAVANSLAVIITALLALKLPGGAPPVDCFFVMLDAGTCAWGLAVAHREYVAMSLSLSILEAFLYLKILLLPFNQFGSMSSASVRRRSPTRCLWRKTLSSVFTS